MVAAGIGATGGELGQIALQGGKQLLSDILPALSFEPAYAHAAGGIAGGVIAATPARVGAEQTALTAGTVGTTMHMSDASEPPSGREPDYNSQNEFVNGKKTGVVVEAKPGLATEIGNGFKDVDKILKKAAQMASSAIRTRVMD